MSFLRLWKASFTTNIFFFFTVLGLDLLSTEQVYGHQVKSSGQERVVLPDTSHYIEELQMQTIGDQKYKPIISAIFPKYNNYVKNPALFDRTSKFFAPLDLLGIRTPADSSPNQQERSVVSYIIYRTAGDILPQNFEANLKQRYGVDLTLPSTTLGLAILDSEGNILNESIEKPIKYRIRVDYVNQRVQPQCVHWKAHGNQGRGTWSREGCRTEFHDPWTYDQEDVHVNCTCSHANAPVSVIMNKEEFLVI